MLKINTNYISLLDQVRLPNRLQIGKTIWDTTIIQAANCILLLSDEIEIVSIQNLRIISIILLLARQSISITAQVPAGPTAVQQ